MKRQSIQGNKDVKQFKGTSRDKRDGRQDSEQSQDARLLNHPPQSSKSAAGKLAQLDFEYARLLRFYVAAEQMLNARSSEALFDVVHEIVANLIGCEEVGIYHLNDGCKLSLVSSRGLGETHRKQIPLGSSLIGTTLLTGKCYFSGESTPNIRLPEETDLSASIPLRLNERLYGAIGIFRLLPQKVVLHPGDKELLKLLGRMAAAVLLCNVTHCHGLVAESGTTP